MGNDRNKNKLQERVLTTAVGQNLQKVPERIDARSVSDTDDVIARLDAGEFCPEEVGPAEIEEEYDENGEIDNYAVYNYETGYDNDVSSWEDACWWRYIIDLHWLSDMHREHIVRWVAERGAQRRVNIPRLNRALMAHFLGKPHRAFFPEGGFETIRRWSLNGLYNDLERRENPSLEAVENTPRNQKEKN